MRISDWSSDVCSSDLLATLLRIAPAGDPAAVELRRQIELASHYGLFRPGQAFTEALDRGGRGPEMVVIPHGAVRKIGRASCRARGCQYGEISVVAVT